MESKFARIEAALTHIEVLAAELKADPDGHVRRSIEELRSAFDMRGAIEPAVARVLRSLQMLDSTNHDASRREFNRRAPGLDRLGDVVVQELLPDLRRIGFGV